MDYYQGDDFQTVGSESTSYGIAAVQKLDAYGVELYASHRRFEFENVPNAKGSRLEIVAVEQNNKVQKRINANDRNMRVQIFQQPTNSTITAGRYTKKLTTGQTGIQGKLLDANGNDPILFANVVLFYTNTETAISGVNTDLDGNFKLENVPIGRINLQLSYLSYENLTLPNIEVNSGCLATPSKNLPPSTPKPIAVPSDAKPINKPAAIADMPYTVDKSIDTSYLIVILMRLMRHT